VEALASGGVDARWGETMVGGRGVVRGCEGRTDR
jgi:hypothetical protein